MDQFAPKSKLNNKITSPRRKLVLQQIIRRSFLCISSRKIVIRDLVNHGCSMKCVLYLSNVCYHFSFCSESMAGQSRRTCFHSTVSWRATITLTTMPARAPLCILCANTTEIWWLWTNHLLNWHLKLPLSMVKKLFL